MSSPAPTFPSSPLVTSGAIFDTCRSLLVGNPNDTTVFSNAVLQPYFNLAYPELARIMAQCNSNRVRRDFYFVLTAYDSYCNPFALGVYDLDEPELLWERQSVTVVPIASTGKNTPVAVISAVPHGLGPNNEINIGGVLGSQAPWGKWFVTVIDPLTFTLNGSYSDGNNGTGGFIYQSGSRFVPMTYNDQSGQSGQQISGCLGTWAWIESTFRFRGATNPTEIHVRYWANGNPPQNVNTPLNIEGCADYLAYRISGKAAEQKGWMALSDRYTNEAVGPKREADATGGLLRGFLNGQVLRMQRQQYRRQPFRYNTSDTYGYGDYLYGSPTLSGSGTPAVPAAVRTGWYNVPVINGVAYVDLTQGDTQYILATGPTQIPNYPAPVGFSYRVIIDQDPGGSYPVTWGSRYVGIVPLQWTSGPYAGVGTGNTRTIVPFSVDTPGGNSVVSGDISGPSFLGDPSL